MPICGFGSSCSNLLDDFGGVRNLAVGDVISGYSQLRPLATPLQSSPFRKFEVDVGSSQLVRLALDG
jgi:hypothetical protein